MRVNPIIKKDIKVESRSKKFSLEIFAYEATLLIIFLLVIKSIFSYTSYRSVSVGSQLQELVSLFPIISITEICIIGLVVPIMTASSISGEKERQTFDIMITTSISPWSIILGKLGSAVIKIMLFVIASIPVMAISFIMGGLNWSALFYFVLAALLFAVFSGSVGVFCSSICRKSIASIILSYVIYGCFFGLTFVPMLIAVLSKGRYETSVYLLLANPVVFFEEFYTTILYGESGLGLINGNGWIKSGTGWMTVSGIVILLIAVFFIYTSTKKINPMKSNVVQIKKKSE